jgi:hypothetical protein
LQNEAVISLKIKTVEKALSNKTHKSTKGSGAVSRGAALPPEPPRREEQKQETTLELAL